MLNLSRPVFQVEIVRVGVQEGQLKPRSILSNFPPLIQLCILLVPFPATLRLLCEDVVLTEWALLVEPAANLKFNRVIVTLPRRLKLPCLNLLAALCISIPVASTTCVPHPSEGGDDAV